MYFLIFLIIIVVVYVNSFKECFNQENLEKLTPVLLLVVGVTIILCILSSVLKA